MILTDRQITNKCLVPGPGHDSGGQGTMISKDDSFCFLFKLITKPGHVTCKKLSREGP